MSARSDMVRSRDAFISLVWPAIEKACGGGQLRHTESSDHQTDKDLDMQAGIDGYQLQTDKGMRGIASRVQYLPDPRIEWELQHTGYTFTIRLARQSGATTEYEKRLRAIQSDGGYLLPHLWVHAYVSQDCSRLLSVAVVRTKDLFAHTENCRSQHGAWHSHRTKERELSRCYCNQVRTNGAASFLVVPWAHIAASGVDIRAVVNEEILRRPDPVSTFSPTNKAPLHAKQRHEPIAQQSLLSLLEPKR